VVRNIADDGEARTTVRAIDERIAIAPVVAVEQLTQTVRTYRDVWRDEGANFFSLVAMNNAESLIRTDLRGMAGYVVHGYARNPRQGRRFGRQVLDEILNRFCRALNFDGYAGGCVVNRALKMPAGSETIDVRAKSNALHDS